MMGNVTTRSDHLFFMYIIIVTLVVLDKASEKYVITRHCQSLRVILSESLATPPRLQI